MKRAAKKSPAARLALLHRAYVRPRPSLDEQPPRLRPLATRMGVPFRDAERAAALGAWDLEREAKHSAAWLARCWPAAPTDSLEAFAEYAAFNHYPHLVRRGTEGLRLAMAHGMDIGVDALTTIWRWHAHQEMRAARRAFRDFERSDSAARRRPA